MFKKLSHMKKRMISVSREKMEEGERLWLMINTPVLTVSERKKGFFAKVFI